jgi:hypothetical protein
VNALLMQNTRVNHADIVPHVTVVNRNSVDLSIARF